MKKFNLRKKLTGVMCIALAGAMLLTGCMGKNKDKDENGNGNSASDSADKTTPASSKIDVNCVYHEAGDVEFPEGYNSQGTAIFNDSIYIYGTKYNEQKWNLEDSAIFIFGLDGKQTGKIPFAMSDNKYMQGNFTVDNDGNIYCVTCEYPSDFGMNENDYDIDDFDENKDDDNPDTDGDDIIEGDDSLDDSFGGVMPRTVNVPTAEAAAPADDADDIDADTDDAPVDGDDIDKDDMDILPIDDGFYGDDGDMGMYQEIYTLIKIDKDGNTVFEKDLSDCRGDADYFYVNSIYCVDGNIYALTETSVIIFDTDGNKKGEISGQESGISYIERLFVSKDNKLIAYYHDDTEWKPHFSEINAADSSFSTEYKIEIGDNYNIINGSGEYDFIQYNSSELRGCNLDSGESVKLVDWVDSDINASNLMSCDNVNESKFLISYFDELDGGVKLQFIEKTAPEDIKEKEIITLAGLYIDSRVYANVIKYNKSNDNFRIKVIDYSQYNTDDEEGWDAGRKKMNADMGIGNVADIIMINNSGISGSILNSKGILADINPFIENDSEINRSDLLENVLDAYTVDGKLCTLPTAFNIQTLIGKTSNLEGKTGWTVSEFIEFAENLDDGKEIMRPDYMTSNNLVSILFTNSLSSFVNYSEKSCSFNDEEFIKVLEYANKYPSSEKYYENMEDMTDDEWNDYYTEMESSCRSGKTILESFYIYDPGDLYRTEKGRFGDDITFVGYPNKDRKGSMIGCQLEFGIYSKSKNQSGAWDFIKQFLTKENQETQWYGLPVRKDALEKKFDDAMTPYTYVDQDGNTVEDKNYYYYGNQEIEIGYMKEADKKRYMDFIMSVDTKNEFDETIYEIVNEETEAYFSGQKSAKDVADLIQNRVKTYLNETL